MENLKSEAITSTQDWLLLKASFYLALSRGYRDDVVRKNGAYFRSRPKSPFTKYLTIAIKIASFNRTL